MADGRVVIDIKANDGELRKAEGSIKSFSASMILVKGLEKAFQALSASMGGAIKRFDTLDQYPRVLGQMGFEAETSERSITQLSDGIQGLPTRLDDVVGNTQRLVTSFRDVDLATDTTLALNNALLASGATTDGTARATEQYIKMMSSGKIEMDTWSSLSESMSYALSEVSAGMGYSAENTWGLYDALKNGDVSLRDFNKALIDASSGTGGFAEIAKTSTEGIATSWANVKTSVVIGLEGIIRAVDDVSEAVTGKSIAQNLDGVKNAVRSALGGTANAIRTLEPVVSGLFNTLKTGAAIAKALDFAIIGLIANFVAFQTIQKVSTWMDGVSTVAGALTEKFTLMGPITLQTVEALEKATLAQKAFGLITAVVTGQMTLAQAASIALAATKKALQAVMNPVSLAIGLVIGALAGLFKYLTRTTPEVKEMNEAIEDAIAETQEMNRSMDSSARAYESNQKHIKNQSNATKQLADDTIDLASATELNSAEKKILEQNIEALNDSVEDLNVSYDEENGLLSESADYIMYRVEAMQEEEKMIASQERLHEISVERGEADDLLTEKQLELKDAQDLLDESGQKLFGGNKDLKESIEVLEAEIANLEEGMGSLSEEEKRVREDSIAAAEAHAEALAAAEEQRLADLRASVETHGWLYDQLADDQKASIDTMADQLTEMADNAQNAFDRINDESKVSAEEMLANLEHNAEMTRQWGEDRASMMEIASKDGNEGFLRWLETLGPDSAAELNTVVNMSDEQLEEFVGLMNDAPVEATDAFNTSLGEGMDEAARLAEEKAGLLENSIYETINEEAFAEIGADIGLGLAGGIESSTGSAVDATVNMSEEVDSSFRRYFRTKSPSRLYIEHGQNLIEGLVIGIENKRISAARAMHEVGETMNKAITGEIRTMVEDAGASFSDYSKKIGSFARDTNAAMLQVRSTISNANKAISSELRTSMRSNTAETEKTLKKLTTSVNNTSRMLGISTSNTMRDISRTINTQTSMIHGRWQATLNSTRIATVTGFNQMYMAINSALRQAEIRARSASLNIANNLRAGIASATSAGYQMGMGFYMGLRSTQGSINNMARSIARTASATIRKELRIASPSKVSFGFGEDYGMGFVGGIGSMIDKVKQASSQLAESAVPKVNASTLGGLALAGVGAVTNNSSSKFTINIGKIENHSDSDIPKILEEATWIMGRERGRLDG